MITSHESQLDEGTRRGMETKIECEEEEKKFVSVTSWKELRCNRESRTEKTERKRKNENKHLKCSITISFSILLLLSNQF